MSTCLTNKKKDEVWSFTGTGKKFQIQYTQQQATWDPSQRLLLCLFVIKYILISFETNDHAFQFNPQKQNFKVKKTEDKKHLVYEG